MEGIDRSKEPIEWLDYTHQYTNRIYSHILCNTKGLSKMCFLLIDLQFLVTTHFPISKHTFVNDLNVRAATKQPRGGCGASLHCRSPNDLRYIVTLRGLTFHLTASVGVTRHINRLSYPSSLSFQFLLYTFSISFYSKAIAGVREKRNRED